MFVIESRRLQPKRSERIVVRVHYFKGFKNNNFILLLNLGKQHKFMLI